MTRKIDKTEKSPDGTDIDLARYLPQMLNQVAARMNERLAEELRTIDLPLPHWRIIAILNWRGACSLKEIRQWTVIDMSTASRAVKRLEEQGYVSRDWKSDDSRSRQISLTQKGDKLFARASPIVAGFHHYIFGDRTNEDHEAMMRVLDGALDRLGRSIWSEGTAKGNGLETGRAVP